MDTIITLKIDSKTTKNSLNMLESFSVKLNDINQKSSFAKKNLSNLFDKKIIIKDIEDIKNKLDSLSKAPKGNLDSYLKDIIVSLNNLKTNLNNTKIKLDTSFKSSGLKTSQKDFKDLQKESIEYQKTVKATSSSLKNLFRDFSRLSKEVSGASNSNKEFNKTNRQIMQVSSYVGKEFSKYSKSIFSIVDSIQNLSKIDLQRQIQNINSDFLSQKQVIEKEYQVKSQSMKSDDYKNQMSKIQDQIEILRSLSDNKNQNHIENVIQTSKITTNSFGNLSDKDKNIKSQKEYQRLLSEVAKSEKQKELDSISNLQKQYKDEVFEQKLEESNDDYESFLENENTKMDVLRTNSEQDYELKIQKIKDVSDYNLSTLSRDLKNETNLEKRRQIEKQIEDQKAKKQQDIMSAQNEKNEKIKQTIEKSHQDRQKKLQDLQENKRKLLKDKFEKDRFEKLQIQKKEIQDRFDDQRKKQEALIQTQKIKQKEDQAKLDAEYQNKIIELEYQKELKITQVKRQQERSKKAVDIAKASANTALAITQTFAQLGAIAGAIALPIMLGTLGAQISSISSVPLSQDPPRPQKIMLSKGGIVRSRNGGMDAVVGEGVDDELVLPLNESNIKKYTQVLSNQTNNQKKEFNPTFNINMNLHTQDLKEGLEEISDELVVILDKKIKDYNENMDILR